MTTPQSRERVLVVDEDWGVLDLITGQVLEPLGYSTASALDADGAIQQVLSFEPDLIIASLTLPGLSGKDLIVALQSRGIEAPVLVTANEGMEADAIQAFRLGACNLLVKPLREAEVAAAVENALNEYRIRKERQELTDKLAHSNRQLKQRVRELITLFGISKAVTSMTSQPQLLLKLVDESVAATKADMGWILLHDELNEALMLRAQSGFPPPVASKLHQAWDDGLSPLVMQSGDALSLHGEDLEQYELGQYAKTAIVSPICVHAEPIGVIGVAWRELKLFEGRDVAMMAAVADFASISLVNVRLFQALAARAQKLEQILEERKEGIHVRTSWLEDVSERLSAVGQQLDDLAKSARGSRTKTELRAISDKMTKLIQDVADVSSTQPSGSMTSTPETP
jgi:DNA-binding response OmpR family regulator